MPGSGNVVDPAARDKYLLQVTAGPSYDPLTHNQVSVNGKDATSIDSELVKAWIRIRIKEYHGLPHGSPASSAYFEHKLHTSDRYSIAYSFVPKQDISGTDLVMGFDYNHSIRHQLPPGTKYAMKIATSMLDPGLYSDPYSDEPYLYGPALSSWFAFRVGERVDNIAIEEQLRTLESSEAGVVAEGAEGSGSAIRKDHGMPDKWKKRRKHFLDAKALANFVFEKDRMYHADFFNPHLDFANFSLRLPGFSISVAKYVDEKTHHLRYVLKNRKTGEVLFVVFFKLLFGEELDSALAKDKGKHKSTHSEPVLPDRTDDQPKRTNRTEDEPERTDDPVKKALTKVDGSHPSSQQLSIETDAEDNNKKELGMIGTATAAATDLGKSIYAFYAALGFANSSSSSDSDSESGKRTNPPQPSSRSMHAQIDDMDNATVEQYLQARHSSVS